MIRPDLQMFAKSASAQRQYRKAQAVSKYAQGGSTIQQSMKKEESAQKKPEPEKKLKKGEVVTQVSTREEYVIYLYANGKEVPLVQDGKQVIRTGKQILEKMTFNKQRNIWESKAKKTYRIRKKV